MNTQALELVYRLEILRTGLTDGSSKEALTQQLDAAIQEARDLWRDLWELETKGTLTSP